MGDTRQILIKIGKNVIQDFMEGNDIYFELLIIIYIILIQLIYSKII